MDEKQIVFITCVNDEDEYGECCFEIQERHPNNCERHCRHMKDIVEHPQCIVEANKPYTALILQVRKALGK